MDINYENIASAYATINGKHKKVSKIFETVNGVWELKYSSGPSISDVLIDFEYTDNGNGTYTLTGWKGTLNGVASTELVIPDDARIIL